MTMLPDPQAAFVAPSFRPEMAFPYLTEDMIRYIRSYGTEAEYDNGAQVSTAGTPAAVFAIHPCTSSGINARVVIGGIEFAEDQETTV